MLRSPFTAAWNDACYIVLKDAFVIREQDIFMQLYSSNIGDVLHAPILDK